MVNDWDAGATEEISFWRAWLSTGGLDWPTDFRYRTNPKAKLQAELARYNDGADPFRILDVGAGPLTIVGKSHPDFAVDITAIDALAHQYDALLASLSIVPLVPTQRMEAEHIGDHLAAGSFDLAFAHNSLDHMRDPIGVLRQMIEVTRVGGVIVLKHVRDVADAEGHAGLHQWNISTAGKRLHVGDVDVVEELDGVETLKLSRSGIWDTAVLRRT